MPRRVSSNLRYCASISLRVKSAASLTRDFKKSVAEQDPADAVTRLKCPLLLVHGAADDVVPAAISRRLYSLAPFPKKLLIAEGAGHDFLDRREWLTRVTADWLAARLRA